MAERASRLMSADEFLAWDDGTDTRYELIDGVPVAFVPGGASHVQVTGNITRIADDAVRDRRPCRAVPGGGLRLRAEAPGRIYIPDVLLTCEPVDDRMLYEEARLVVEVLSPSTQTYDKNAKLPHYAAMPAMEEIWLVGSRARSVVRWERVDGQWGGGNLPLIGRATFWSRVLGIEVSLDAIYALTNLQAG